jgi:hypothetical protein
LPKSRQLGKIKNIPIGERNLLPPRDPSENKKPLRGERVMADC